MPSIVIIYHPGNEPSIPKNKNYHIIDWNRLSNSNSNSRINRHSRKFLLSKGRYIRSINDQIENEGCLTFWVGMGASIYCIKNQCFWYM